MSVASQELAQLQREADRLAAEEVHSQKQSLKPLITPFFRLPNWASSRSSSSKCSSASIRESCSQQNSKSSAARGVCCSPPKKITANPLCLFNRDNIDSNARALQEEISGLHKAIRFKIEYEKSF